MSVNTSHTFISSLAASLLVAAPAVRAQDRPTSPRDTLSAVVVTATRVAVTTAAPTASVTVLRGDDLRAQGITRVLDALRLVPGADVVASGPIGSQTSLFMRGGNSNYVRVLVDGVPVNDAGGTFDFSTLGTDNIDRIEIVRGPGSVIYGSDAMTGVVQIFTKDGRGPLATSALVGGGSRGQVRGDLAFRGGDASTGFSLMGSHEATDGTYAFNNGFRNDDLSGALRLTPDASTDARLTARWSSATYHFPTDFTGAVVDHNAEQTDHRLVLSADGGHRFNDRVELRASVASNEYLPRSNNPPDSVGDDASYSRAVRVHRSGDVLLNLRYDRRGVFTIGGEVAGDRENSSSLSISSFGNSAGSFEASRHNTALFAQAVGDAGGRFSYSVGARLDENSAFGQFETVRASAGYAVNGNLRVRASVGNAFVAPTFDENFSTGFVIGNPALRPEQSRSAETGADLYLADGALTLRVTGFAQKFANIIDYSGTAPTPTSPNYYNVAAADANGVELAADYRGFRGTTLRGSYTYTDTRTTKAGFDSTTGANYVVGQRLIRRPPNLFSGSITSALRGGGTLTLAATYVGERDDRDFVNFPATPVTLPAYTKVDVSAVLPLERRNRNGLALVGRVDNLFDAQYQEIFGYPAPGRLVFVGLRYGR